MGAVESISTAALYGMIEAHIARAARAMDCDTLELTQSVFFKRSHQKHPRNVRTETPKKKTPP
jgi:hypothetical protein